MNSLDRQGMLLAAMESSQDCVKLISPDGVMLYMNPGGCELMEIESAEQVLGLAWADLWPEPARPRLQAALAQGRENRTDRFAATCPTAKGQEKHWDVLVTPLLDEGEVKLLLVTSRDVSELAQARLEAEARQRALERQAAALRAAGRVAKLGGWELDLRTWEVHWSDEIWEVLGASPRPIAFDDAMQIYPPADRAWVAEHFERARVTGERINFRTRVRRFDGVEVPIRVFGEPVLEGGACVALRGAAQDLSEVRLAEQALEGAERRLRMAVEMSDILVFEVDYQHRRVFSEGAEHLFFEHGLTYEAMRRDPLACVHPLDRESARSAWEEAERTGSQYRTEYRVARSDGREVWAHSTCRLERDRDGAPIRLVGALQDITDRKRVEQELIAARDQADAANASKSAFLANVSHEIRTPLNGILGMAQVMARSNLPREEKERLEVIRQSGNSLMGTLNDVLDLSKIEAGRLETERVEFNLRECVQTACEPFRMQALQKDLHFEMRIADEVDRAYVGDPLRLRQVLTNLVSNAVKFTSRGGVTVEVGAASDRIRMAVRDTGIGLDAAQQSAVFAKFAQADASTTRRYGGTGLGLAICRELAALMGGRVWVESEQGVGSAFHFELDLGAARRPVATTAVREPAPAPGERPALRILAAEDNPTNRLVLQALLEPTGAELVQVEDGAMAVAAAASGDFDLILMDIQMPQMSGVEATTAIRRRERDSGLAPVPILALTANVMAHQLAEYRGAGMDGCVAKPVQAERLYEAIEEALSREAAAQVEQTRPTGAAAQA